MKPRAYLAGGFHTGWDDEAEQLLPSWNCIKPKTHGLTDPDLFTPMDMGLIENSSAVLAKFEYFDGVTFANIAFELGYARRSGKFIVVVMDPEVTEHFKERYFGMPMAAADAVFRTVEDACLYLNTSYFGGSPEFAVVPARPVSFGPEADGPLHGRFVKEERESRLDPVSVDVPTMNVEGWIVDFIGDQPSDFDPDSVIQGTDETGFPDMVWGRDESFQQALMTAAAIAVDEGVLFDDETAITLLGKAAELDNVPYQTPGYRFVCIRRVGV